jgi:DNA-binding CsgD family transcriptional regulator
MRSLIIQFAVIGVLLALLLAVGQYTIFVRAESSSWLMAGFALIFIGIGTYLGIRRSARTARSHEPPFATPYPEERARALGISPREHDVLALIAHGLSNQEIGDRLHISETTVKSHVSSLLSKLDARRRTQAVKIAKEYGLLP